MLSFSSPIFHALAALPSSRLGACRLSPARLSPARLVPLLARNLVHSAAMRMSSSYNIRDVLDDVKEGKAQLIDCREPYEWEAGHLLLAKPAPLSVLQQGILPGDISPDEKIYIHCAAGVRVHAAAPLMRQLGCESVVPLQEGFASLLNLGLALDRGKPPPA
ncbi:Rhodanese-like domain-containing protein [Pavlovales sp. CCMP2436]|nr:Rhodanese-like domain-containing protein [Pavlovales sp. CCMP2436]